MRSKPGWILGRVYGFINICMTLIGQFDRFLLEFERMSRLDIFVIYICTGVNCLFSKKYDFAGKASRMQSLTSYFFLESI